MKSGLGQRILCALYGHKYKIIEKDVEIHGFIIQDLVEPWELCTVTYKADFAKCDCGNIEHINKKEISRKYDPVKKGEDSGNWLKRKKTKKKK
jgi:hypothetical protein